jgi:hypothetical protein
MLQDAYQRELRKFDEGRVLKAWDGLISKQQTRLESLGVPNMFVGSQPQAREVRNDLPHPSSSLPMPLDRSKRRSCVFLLACSTESLIHWSSQRRAQSSTVAARRLRSTDPHGPFMTLAHDQSIASFFAMHHAGRLSPFTVPHKLRTWLSRFH